MKNFVQRGDILTLTAPSGDAVAGLPCKVGTIVAIPTNSAAEGEIFEGEVTGVWELAKATGAAWSQGAAIYWDDSAKKCTTTATSNTLIGVATVAAASGDTVGIVRLNGAF